MPKSEDCFQFFLNDSLKSENTNTCCWRAIFIDTFVKAAKEAGMVIIGIENSRNKKLSFIKFQNSLINVSTNKAKPVFSGVSLETPLPSFSKLGFKNPI